MKRRFFVQKSYFDGEKIVRFAGRTQPKFENCSVIYKLLTTYSQSIEKCPCRVYNNICEKNVSDFLQACSKTTHFWFQDRGSGWQLPPGQT